MSDTNVEDASAAGGSNRAPAADRDAAEQAGDLAAGGGEHEASTAKGEEGGKEEGEVPEMVPPDVSEELVASMVEMGFGRNRAVRALHFSEGGGVDSAVAWLAEHEEDMDLDEELLVPKKRKMTAEEMKQQATDLVRRAKERRQQEEKELQKTQERERVRYGKELLMAKKKEEEESLKRRLEERKRDKEEEAAARAKIKAKLEEDRKERRRKLGLPEELTEEEKAELEEKRRKREEEGGGKKHGPRYVRPVGTLSDLRARLVAMKHDAPSEPAFKTACATLLKYLGNIARAPEEDKYRRIRLANAAFRERVAAVPGAVEFLEGCGFGRSADGEFLEMAADGVDLELMNGAGGLVDSAIKNPFFGAL
eukprot:evm.model.scf_157.3 EVM.evm.TU.scf_157.3   scf_157:58146-63341(+)